MNQGDELLAMVREAVRAHAVPREQQSAVTELVARVAVTVMSQPRFYRNLRVVLDLQDENAVLRQQLANLSAVVYRSGMVRKPAKPRRKVPAKKAAVKKAAAATSITVASVATIAPVATIFTISNRAAISTRTASRIRD